MRSVDSTSLTDDDCARVKIHHDPSVAQLSALSDSSRSITTSLTDEDYTTRARASRSISCIALGTGRFITIHHVHTSGPMGGVINGEWRADKMRNERYDGWCNEWRMVC